VAVRSDLLAIVRAGVRAADAGTLLGRAFDATGVPGGPVIVIATGKASPAMARCAADRLGGQLRSGLAISSTAAAVPASFERIMAGHPAPNPDSERAGRRALDLARTTPEDATLLVLLSGGASALMAVPAPGLTVEDKRDTTGRLMHAGADIHSLNTVRKHLSAIKGGRLAAAARGPCRCLAISDVVGDDPSVIGSGPTVADPTTFADALEALDRFGGRAVYPPAVVTRLARGAAGQTADTPKPGDARLARTQTTIIGSRSDAMAGAAAKATDRGYAVVIIREAVVGEARFAARRHVDRVAALVPTAARPLCVVSAGETTVTVVGRGQGGRNQEFALASAELLPALGPAAVVASIGTDGIDGPTDAAGAFVDQTTAARAASAGLAHPREFLNDNNSYAFFRTLGDLIITGPSDTNVGDLQVVLVP
jgi:hydroxypyruvate reductase